MEPIGEGWFRAAALRPGEDYGFSLDGGAPVPDPRSQRQPKGVFAPSRVVRHEAFKWTDAGWKGLHLPSAIIYELHVGTFSSSGTFDSSRVGRRRCRRSCRRGC